MKVIPYTTTSWKRNVGCILSPEKKRFNWFLFGKLYYSEKNKSFMLDVPKGLKFYNIATGVTYSIEDTLTIYIEKKNAKGYACAVKCCFKMCCKSCFCHEVVFNIPPKYLKRLDDSFSCDFIFYMKYHYPTFSKKDKTFPTPKKIDELLKKKTCAEVCKILYDHLNACIG